MSAAEYCLLNTTSSRECSPVANRIPMVVSKPPEMLRPSASRVAPLTRIPWPSAVAAKLLNETAPVPVALKTTSSASATTESIVCNPLPLKSSAMLALVNSTSLMLKVPIVLTSIIELPSLLPLKEESLITNESDPSALTARLASALTLLNTKPELSPESSSNCIPVPLKSSTLAVVTPLTTSAVFVSEIVKAE